MALEVTSCAAASIHIETMQCTSCTMSTYTSTRGLIFTIYTVLFSITYQLIIHTSAIIALEIAGMACHIHGWQGVFYTQTKNIVISIPTDFGGIFHNAYISL